MIGEYPTVGFIVFMGDAPAHEASERVLQSLDSLIAQNTRLSHDSVPSYTSGVIGNARLEAIMYTQDTQDGIFVCINFDEDQVVDVSRNTGLTIAELLSPYVAALETVVGNEGVGVGFEVSPPDNTEDKALKDAGIALFFVRDKNTKKWMRKEITPVVGHYT
jgi:hypothetical protein